MMTFEEVEWVGLRPTQEETVAGLCGVRANKYGVRMEVRISNTVEHGKHVVWKVYGYDHNFLVVGQIPLTPGLAPSIAFNEGKQLAVKFAELYASQVL